MKEVLGTLFVMDEEPIVNLTISLIDKRSYRFFNSVTERNEVITPLTSNVKFAIL